MCRSWMNLFQANLDHWVSATRYVPLLNEPLWCQLSWLGTCSSSMSTFHTNLGHWVRAVFHRQKKSFKISRVLGRIKPTSYSDTLAWIHTSATRGVRGSAARRHSVSREKCKRGAWLHTRLNMACFSSGNMVCHYISRILITLSLHLLWDGYCRNFFIIVFF